MKISPCTVSPSEVVTLTRIPATFASIGGAAAAPAAQVVTTALQLAQMFAPEKSIAPALTVQESVATAGRRHQPCPSPPSDR